MRERPEGFREGETMVDLVLPSIERGVLTLTFNRPDRLNAWTDEMGRRYFDQLAEAEKNPEVRVIVVTGAGRGFCAGADFQTLTAIQDGSYAGEPDRRPNTFPTTIRKPIIAAVNGACAGLGMVHALVCDLVFTAAEAKWTTAFARRGLVAEYGLSWILPRLAGQARAMDLLLSGRTFTGAEACELGLANRAVPGERLIEETLAYAHELATYSSPASMAVIKRQIWGDWQRTLEASESAAARLMVDSFTRPDFAEGVASFVERRVPGFPPL
ncbi:enoyl-CoA hydratase-related protein [Streptosporangium sp. NPDC002544]|uniref:enoyl-CoA hydratase-related protein n=1 Tax=unclassified Streptosporangium TaxID=2632669 RepID=UPI00332ABF1B